MQRQVLSAVADYGAVRACAKAIRCCKETKVTTNALIAINSGIVGDPEVIKDATYPIVSAGIPIYAAIR